MLVSSYDCVYVCVCMDEECCVRERWWVSGLGMIMFVIVNSCDFVCVGWWMVVFWGVVVSVCGYCVCLGRVCVCTLICAYVWDWV